MYDVKLIHLAEEALSGKCVNRKRYDTIEIWEQGIQGLLTLYF